MRYIVRSLDGNMRLVFRENGRTVDSFDTATEARVTAVGAGMSFEVLEAESPFRRVCAGIGTQVGFIVVDAGLEMSRFEMPRECALRAEEAGVSAMDMA